VIVPTIRGREESLARCVESYGPDVNVIVVEGSPTCGEGWIAGLERSSAPFIHFSCDDLEVRNGAWIEACTERAGAGDLPCPYVFQPDGSIESAGGDMKVEHNLLREWQPDGTEVDFTPVPFLSRDQLEHVQLLPTQYLCDVWVSYRGKHFGYDTVLTEGYELTHHRENVGRRPTSRYDVDTFQRALAAVAGG